LYGRGVERRIAAFVDELIQLRDGNVEFSNTFNLPQSDLDLLLYDVTVARV